MKALKLIPAIAIILLFTTCEKEEWYNNYEDFEQVLVNGRWEINKEYLQPDPETPNIGFSRQHNGRYFNRGGYYLYRDSFMYLIKDSQYSSEDTCTFFDDVYNNYVSCSAWWCKWEVYGDTLREFLYTPEFNTYNFDYRFKIVNYSDRIIKLEAETEIVLEMNLLYDSLGNRVLDTNGNYVFDNETVTVKWYRELINIK